MHRLRLNSRGFGYIELLVAITVTAIGIAFASGLILAGKGHIKQQDRELEATQAGRASIDTILRELRLGGACLPETGEFIALEAVDNGDEDELVTRYGRTTADMSCIQTATSTAIAGSATAIPVDDSSGFEAGDYAYIRHTNGSGEYFTVASIDTTNQVLTIDRALTSGYPATSGVYAIDERRFFIDTTAGTTPQLMFQVGGQTPQPFALGVEKLEIDYELSDGNTVDEPVDDQEWRSVSRIHLSLTTRSVRADPDGNYYRRTNHVTIKPRNLIDS